MAKNPEGLAKEMEKIDRELYLDSLNEPDFEDIIIEHEKFLMKLPDEKKDIADMRLFSLLSPDEKNEYEEYLINVPNNKMEKLTFQKYRKLSPEEKVNVTIPEITDSDLEYGYQYDEEALDAIKKYLSYMPNNAEEAPPEYPVPPDSDEASKKILDIIPANEIFSKG